MIRALQQWSKTYHARGKYTPVGVAFHWIMAAVVAYQLVTGWLMQRHLVGPDKLEAYRLHSEIGLTLLLIGALRLLWRLIVPGPINDADKLGWQTTMAHTTHIVFYTLFVILPLSGWAMWSAIQPARPLTMAGLVSIPPMPFHSLSREWQYRLLDLAEDVHLIGVILLSVLVISHVGAALKHHFLDRDDVLEGMLPEVPDSHWHPEGRRYAVPDDPPPVPPEGG